MGKITYTRGTTYTITHIYKKNGVPSTAGTMLYFTVKPTQNDSDAADSTAIIDKQISMSGATTVFSINPADVAVTVQPGDYYYDIKVKETTSPLVVYLADSGAFTLTATPTNVEA